MSNSNKRRLSQLNSSNSDDNAPCNAQKQNKNQASPEKSTFVNVRFSEMTKYIEDRELDKAMVVSRYLETKNLKAFEKRILSVVKYLCKKANSESTKPDLVTKLILSHPYEFAYRFIRFFLDTAMCRFEKMQDAIVLKRLTCNDPSLPSFNFPLHMDNMQIEERSIHFKKLASRFPSQYSSEVDGASDVETLNDFVSFFYSHPIGSYLNQDCVTYFQPRNMHLFQKAQCSSSKSPSLEKSEERPVQVKKGKKAGKKKSSSTNEMPSVSTRSMSLKSRDRRLKECGLEASPWDEQEDYSISRYSPKSIMKQVGEACGSLADVLIKEDDEKYHADLDFTPIQTVPISIRDLKQYENVFNSNSEFSSLLCQVGEKLKSVKTKAAITDYCSDLGSIGTPFSSYFMNYITIALLIVEGNVTAANAKADSALNQMDYPGEDASNEEVDLWQCLINSMYLLKAMAAMASCRYRTCFAYASKIIQTDPGNMDLHNFMIKLLYDDRKYEEANDYMKHSTFAVSMQFTPVHIIFDLILTYDEIKPMSFKDALAHVRTRPFVSTIREIKEYANVPFEMNVWISGIILELMLKSKGEKCDLSFLCNLLNGPEFSNTTLGSSSNLMQGVMKAIRNVLANPSNKYNDFVSSVFPKGRQTTIHREESIKLLINSSKWNYLIVRFMHDFLVEEWSRLVNDRHGLFLEK